MWTVHQKAQFVLRYAELKSVDAVQRKWRSLCPGEKPPTDKALNRWMNQFKETGTVEKQKSTGRPIRYFLSYSGFKSRPSFSMSLYIYI